MVPASVRRKAVSMLFLKQRAIQEKKDITDESKRMIVFLENRLMKIQQRCEEYSREMNVNNHPWKTGANAMLQRYAFSLEDRITSCREILSRYVPDLPSCPRMSRIDHQNKEETVLRREDDETENVYDNQLADLDLESIETYHSDSEETDDELADSPNIA